MVNGLNPDIIMFTGDMGDGLIKHIKDFLSPLANLKAKYGIYYVTGNHEYYWGANDYIEEAKKLGFTTLVNSNVIINYHNFKIGIAGITDLQGGKYIKSHKPNYTKATEGLESANYKIMLSHQPNNYKKLAKLGFDLQLSGHTHGGQFFL